MGFLPGTAAQKMSVFEQPYTEICAKLFDNSSAYQNLKNKGIISFESTSFLRGLTVDNTIIILDEFQNLDQHGITTVMSRVGNNSKIILCGDKKQDDLSSERFKEISGANAALKICSRIPSMRTVEFNVEDIVRSGFARELALAMIECGL